MIGVKCWSVPVLCLVVSPSVPPLSFCHSVCLIVSLYLSIVMSVCIKVSLTPPFSSAHHSAGCAHENIYPLFEVGKHGHQLDRFPRGPQRSHPLPSPSAFIPSLTPSLPPSTLLSLVDPFLPQPFSIPPSTLSYLPLSLSSLSSFPLYRTL